MGGVYPDPNITDMDTMYSYANTITDGMLGLTFVAACAIITFVLLLQRGHKPSQCLASSGVVSMVMSSFIWAMGYMKGEYIIFCVVLTVVGLIWTTVETH